MNREHHTPHMVHGTQVYMHLDNKFKLPVGTRITSPRRLGVNLGPGSRGLKFAVPDILAIAKHQGLGPDDIPRTQWFFIRGHFL